MASLGEEITRDYLERAPTLISVLKGGSVFLADLFRCIDLPVRVDFMSISHYAGEAEGSGVVRILKDLDDDIVGRDVILVEDIIDTGLTLSYLLAALRARGRPRWRCARCWTARRAGSRRSRSATGGSNAPTSSSSATGWTSVSAIATFRSFSP